ncbi:MAG: hypothetical protein COW88_01885 [Candidatus Lloydbacteria bacterium CG22_combo_CG10-13_8_21_14_all_47_15]|uniref:Uncharacterized protein n=1 Tax=Candidatus Lloydbacteria bacterium CG22_combo_CG10-13_8_21_14_all_47_15 TaxID=1974635 RepID=A0A2H0CU74_9BACT|nr:MAG: hypothetical protein COW88_01885 [Candidatus Lloydbacteria bacterium CG22_combo_CG10-13_8_21_14_all_47_15]
MEFNINKYLEKFRGLQSSDDFLIQDVITAVKKETGVLLEKKNIRISNTTAYITTSPALKNIIFIKKEALVNIFNKKRSKLNDIR